MVVACSSKTMVPTNKVYGITSKEDISLHSHCHEDLKSHSTAIPQVHIVSKPSVLKIMYSVLDFNSDFTGNILPCPDIYNYVTLRREFIHCTLLLLYSWNFKFLHYQEYSKTAEHASLFWSTVKNKTNLILLFWEQRMAMYESIHMCMCVCACLCMYLFILYKWFWSGLCL